MRRRIELIAPIVASNGRQWHELRRTVALEIPDGGAVEVELACAAEVAGKTCASWAIVPAHELRGKGSWTLPAIELNPTGSEDDEAILDERGHVDGRGIAEEEVTVTVLG
jgi:hypothetical protein